MKLLTLLFLCSRLLPSLTHEAVSEELDCNDEDVFKAVDAALKKFNQKQKQSSHQFVLYRITEASKTAGTETFYSFKYEIKEGNCTAESGKTWQDCDYRDAQEAATGECTATVGKRGSSKFSVATQTCQITPAAGPVVMDQYNCLGCVHPISTDSRDLEPVLKHAVQHFNNNTNHSYLFALGEVKRARRQVVSGFNFEITFTIVQTNCSKEKFPFLTPDCKSLLDGDAGECTGSAYVNIQQSIAAFTQQCELFPGEDVVLPFPKACVGCPIEIPVDSPQLKEALTHSIGKLNAENNETYYFKIETVKRATSQVVAGVIYTIEFTARETECSKQSNTELTESCEPKKLGRSLNCNAKVYVVPWENQISSTVNCQPLTMISMMKRPPGFSPFRTVQVKETGKETTVSPPYTSMVPVQDEEQDAEKDQGPIRGHEKQIKHGVGHGHRDEHGQGHWHQKGHGLGHGQKEKHGLGHGHQHHGLGHGHQPEFDYNNVKLQSRHGPDHGHQMGHDLAHGLKHKHKHGYGHGNHKNKEKEHEKHNDWRTQHLASSSEDSTTSPTHAQEKTGGTTTSPFLAQPDVAVTFLGFQDSDLLEAGMPPTSAPTENDDDWIPDIHIEPDSLSFKLISDFPETTSPKCPGRPWKPISGNNPTMEVKEFHDFDLSDAFS